MTQNYDINSELRHWNLQHWNLQHWNLMTQNLWTQQLRLQLRHWNLQHWSLQHWNLQTQPDTRMCQYAAIATSEFADYCKQRHLSM